MTLAEPVVPRRSTGRLRIDASLLIAAFAAMCADDESERPVLPDAESLAGSVVGVQPAPPRGCDG